MHLKKWVIPATLVVAVALRVLAARGELWLDEIWSLSFARAVRHPLEVFTAIHHDNNHYLNTLYLWALPNSPNWISYRLLSIGAGVGSVVLAILITTRLPSERADRRWASGVAAVVVGVSYWMVLYASEARGYALAVFLAYGAFYCGLRFFERCHWPWVAGIAACSALGFLAHLTYLEAFIGLVAWTGHRLWHGGTRDARWLGRMALMHGLPVTTVALLYVVDLRHLVIGGGPAHPYWLVIESALSGTLGGPLTGPFAVPVALACVILTGIAIAELSRAGSDLWIFFASAILLAPALMLAAFRPDYVAERYFLVSISLMLLALVWLAVDVRSRLGRPRLLLAAVALYAAANLWHVARLIQRGRGSYVPAVHWMASHSMRRPVTIGGDQDFWNGTLIHFYSQLLPGSPMLYLPHGTWPPAGPEWVLVTSQSAHFDPPRELPDGRGNRYELTRVYPFAEVSGWTLALYHNVAG